MRFPIIGEPNGWDSMKHVLFEFGCRPNQTSLIVQRVASSCDAIPSDGKWTLTLDGLF